MSQEHVNLTGLMSNLSQGTSAVLINRVRKHQTATMLCM